MRSLTRTITDLLFVMATALRFAMLGQLFPDSATALDLWENAETGRRAELRTTLKLTGLGMYYPDDAALYASRLSGTALARARFGVDMPVGEKITIELAYEHYARHSTAGAMMGPAAGLRTQEAQVPWRLFPLQWRLAHGGDRFDYRHEVDRALVAIQTDWGSLSLGRQAVGFGRGVLFSAVDVFAPFSPMEVDREWRRGVDALRVEYRTSPLSSIEMTAVMGESWDESALLARGRGYLGEVDGELIAGKRGRDVMAGAVISAAVGGAAVHAEAALFHTPEEQPGGGIFGSNDTVAKGVLGASYTLNIGRGLTLLAEYHYSGFGVAHPAELMERASNPAYVQRLLRGDTQILGRQAAAVQAAYPFGETLTGTLLLLVSPVDGSGIASPTFVWAASQSATLTLNTFLPWGEKPRKGRLQSEYGATPFTLFGQVSLYF